MSSAGASGRLLGDESELNDQAGVNWSLNLPYKIRTKPIKVAD